jgi:hypothetical protein
MARAHTHPPRIVWTDDMVLAITRLRAQGLSVNAIAAKIGVSGEAFILFRRRTGFRLAPIARSKPDLIGWYQEPIKYYSSEQQRAAGDERQ